MRLKLFGFGLILIGSCVALASPMSGLIKRSVTAQYPYETIATTPVGCANPVHKSTTVGLTAGNCPSSNLTNRRFITFCNSAENSGSPTIKIRIDGVAPVTGLTNPGDVLSVGACVTYNISGSIVPQCIASAASTGLTSLECQ